MRRGDTTRRIGMENFTQRQEVGPMPTDVLVTPADLAPLLRLLLEAERLLTGSPEGARMPEDVAADLGERRHDLARRAGLDADTGEPVPPAREEGRT
jgi:hypothetical protein